MNVLLVGGQIVVVLAMVAVSLWGRKNLDDDARVNARLGTSGVDWTMKKSTALVYTPAIGSFVLVGTVLALDAGNGEQIAAVGLALLVMLFLAHWWSVKRAAR